MYALTISVCVRRFLTLPIACRLHPLVNPYTKAARVSEQLEDLLTHSTVYLTCRQLSLLMDCFPQGRLWRYAPARDKDSYFHFGSYRVELLITLLYRVVDLNNLEVLLAALTEPEAACFTCRVGWFNGIFNPLKPEGFHMFNILRHVEDRQVR